MVKKLLLLCCSVILLSCTSSKKVFYLQDAGAIKSESVNYQNTLQPDDNLLITITAEEPELANDFNMMYLYARSTQSASVINNDNLYSYLVDQNGQIDFPVLGKIKVAGLTRIQAEQKLKDLLGLYIKNPGVNLRVLNFKVSVVGEVARPGWQNVTGDRITLFEALSGAGDLTIYGSRKDIMLIREKDGTKQIVSLDITDPNIINSEYYYLAHNDMIYVRPNKTRVNSSVIGPNLTVGLSALGLLVTVIALSVK